MLYAAAVAAAMLAQVAARPMFYDSVHRGCAIPDEGYAGHTLPEADPAVTIIVLKDGEPVTEFIPGESYKLESAAYGAETVNIWVHATGGKIDAIQDPEYAEESHGNAGFCESPDSASYSFIDMDSHEFGWTAPATADCVTISVAQAAGMEDNYHTATVEVCPAAAGGADKPAAAPKKAPTATPPPPPPAPVMPEAAPVMPKPAMPEETMAPRAARPPAPTPPPVADAPASGPCGAGGQPVCAGDELTGREFECDYGYVGEAGVCVDFMDEAMAPSGPDCGMKGQPACNGADLDGREFECDYGNVAEDGVCVDWEPEEVPPSGPDCGKNGQVVCAGDDLAGREFECDFGFVGENGVCVPYTVDENMKEEEMMMEEEAAAPAETDSAEEDAAGEDETEDAVNEKSKM